MEICRQEFRACRNTDLSGGDGGAEFFDATHDFTADLDIFGEKSLFAYINRTATEAGRRRLADWVAPAALRCGIDSPPAGGGA